MGVAANLLQRVIMAKNRRANGIRQKLLCLAEQK
jgi:hypothetical protein